MKQVTKSNLSAVMQWIDNQFDGDNTFPAKCGRKGDKKAVDCGLKAYKKWRKTPEKKSAVREWVDEWLSDTELKSLQKYLDARKDD